MLINLTKCGGRVSLTRLLITAVIAFTMMTTLLYVGINYPQKESKNEINEMDEINLDIKYYISEFAGPNNSEYVEEEEEPFIPLSEIQMNQVSRIMNDRREHLTDVCRENGINQTGYLNSEEYFINDKNKMIWCNVFKEASNSWFYNLNLMPGFTEQETGVSDQLYALSRQIAPSPTIDELLKAAENSLTMIVVRHPLERLSIAYRDKIQSKDKTEEYTKLAKEIVENYRIDYDNVEHEDVPTFEEFARFIIAEYVVGKQLDICWTPYVSFCTPCHFNFDVILKYETLDTDQKYVIQKSGLEDKVKDLWKYNKHTSHSVDNFELVKSHYSQLSNDQLKDFIEIYKYDFMLFDYSLHDFEWSLEDSNEASNEDSDYVNDNLYYNVDYNEDYFEPYE